MEKEKDTRIKVIDKPLKDTLDRMDHDTAKAIVSGAALRMGCPEHMAAAQFMDELAEARVKLATYMRPDSVIRKCDKSGESPYRIRRHLPGVIEQAMAELRATVKEAKRQGAMP